MAAADSAARPAADNSVVETARWAAAAVVPVAQASKAVAADKVVLADRAADPAAQADAVPAARAAAARRWGWAEEVDGGAECVGSSRTR